MLVRIDALNLLKRTAIAKGIRMSDTIREFSRKVDISMIADGVEIDVSGLAGDYLTTSHPFAVSPCVATVTLMLDDEPDRFTVHLVDGIDPSRPRQPILMQD